MDTNMAQSRGVLALSLFGLLGFAILMVTVPKIIPGTENPHVISAALDRGYNAPVAFLVAVLWSVVLLAGAALFLRRDPADPKLMPDVTCGRLVPWELIAVFALFFIAYCPWFVARYGPHMEDHGFIMSMFRMADGQLPFRDLRRFLQRYFVNHPPCTKTHRPVNQPQLQYLLARLSLSSKSVYVF